MKKQQIFYCQQIPCNIHLKNVKIKSPEKWKTVQIRKTVVDTADFLSDLKREGLSAQNMSFSPLGNKS